MCEYIYLVQEREFIKSNEDIYKIGKSKQENLKRFNSYPNGSKLLFQCICTDCNKIERILIKLFREKYELQRYIGNEYFKGGYIEMINDIYNCIYNYIEDDFDIVAENKVVKVEVGKKVVVEKKDVVKNVVANNVIYKCNYCEYTSNKMNNITLHTDIKHRDMKNDVKEEENEYYKCDKCNKIFSTKSNLTRNQKKCKGIINPAQCQKCNKIFSNTSSKCRHTKTCKNL